MKYVRPCLLSIILIVATCFLTATATVRAEDKAPPPQPAAETGAKPAPAPVAAPAADKPDEKSGPPTVAIFIKNRAGAKVDDKVGSFEEQLSSHLTEKGYSIISRENALNAVATFADKGANAGDANAPGANIDKVLSNNTSALRLGQNLGADYILIATMTSYGQGKKAFKGYGVETWIVTSKLRASYTILDVVKGATVPGSGGTVEASTDTRLDSNEAEFPDVINDLLDDASTKLADKMPPPPETRGPEAATTTLSIVCTIQGQTVPDIVHDKDKDAYFVTNTDTPIRALNASVELDGIIIGTATGTFHDVAKGLHKIRVTAKGSEDWSDYEGTVKVTKDMVLNIDLHLTDKGYAKWKEMTLMVHGLKSGEKITDARADAIHGYAQKLRQSGFKVDIKQNSNGPGPTDQVLINKDHDDRHLERSIFADP